MEIEYKNIYIHYVFTTKDRVPLIFEQHRERIEKFITGVVRNYDSRLYAIYANPEHVHMLISRSPAISDNRLATVIAESSEKFINNNHFCVGTFRWQKSAAGFSVSKSAVDTVCRYIMNQAEHHRKKTFDEEYQEFVRFYQGTLQWEK